MSDPGTIRALALFVPVGAVFLSWSWRRPDRRLAAAVLLASAWTFAALVLLQVLAARWGWWHYEAEGGLFLGMPVDLLIGWTLLWAAVPVLVAPGLSLVVWIVLGAWLDLLLMPACAPVVRLGAHWWIGEAVGLLLCCPALLLARWTAEGRHLHARAMLQAVCFSGLLLGVLPAALLALTGGSWQALVARPRWLTSLLLQIVALAALPGLSAVQEFATRGGGTPVPYDPPKHLVTSGVYAYLANPMQLSMSVVLCLWGALLASPWVAVAGLMAVAYSASIAAWDEGGSLRGRHGDAWSAYRARVRAWWPRWRPFVATPARLYVAVGCDPCSALGRWIAAQAPTGLTLVAAEHHPTRALQRLTYDAGDGSAEEDGVAALGRALEHLHLGWAYLGFTLRLPGLRGVAQLLADASGGGPRSLRTRA